MNYKELFKDSMSLLMEPEVKELGELCEFWEQRALLAESIINQSPCDPDITPGQIEAWEKYEKFMEDNYPKFNTINDIKISKLPSECINDWENIVYCSKEGKCLKCVKK